MAGLGPLLSYTLEYAGVLTNTEAGWWMVEGFTKTSAMDIMFSLNNLPPKHQLLAVCCWQETSAGEKKTELLVMRNLRCGSSKHRFLDIKIGQKTAQVRHCPWLLEECFHCGCRRLAILHLRRVIIGQTWFWRIFHIFNTFFKHFSCFFIHFQVQFPGFPGFPVSVALRKSGWMARQVPSGSAAAEHGGWHHQFQLRGLPLRGWYFQPSWRCVGFSVVFPMDFEWSLDGWLRKFDEIWKGSGDFRDISTFFRRFSTFSPGKSQSFPGLRWSTASFGVHGPFAGSGDDRQCQDG